jgi:hypothetical protein
MNAYLTLGKEVFKGSYNQYVKYANVLKHYYKLLLASRYSKESWFFDQRQVTSYIQKECSLEEIIEYCLNFDADLQDAYLFLQDLYKLAKFSSFENIKKYLLDWCNSVDSCNKKLPELKKVSLTYRNWLNEIANSFILNPKTNSRMTNGFIEGKNNFCKVIKRIGFGYKDFNVFRAKILYSNDQSRPFKFLFCFVYDKKGDSHSYECYRLFYCFLLWFSFLASVFNHKTINYLSEPLKIHILYLNSLLIFFEVSSIFFLKY